MHAPCARALAELGDDLRDALWVKKGMRGRSWKGVRCGVLNEREISRWADLRECAVVRVFREVCPRRRTGVESEEVAVGPPSTLLRLSAASKASAGRFEAGAITAAIWDTLQVRVTVAAKKR